MGNVIGSQHDENQPERDRGRRQPALPRQPGAGRVSDEAGDARQDRRFCERAQVVESVKRSVELLGEHRCTPRRREGHQHADEDEPDPIRRQRLLRRNGRIQDPELLALSTLLHALRELGVLVPLQQRGVALLRRLEILRHLLELLLALRGVLDPSLVRVDGTPEALFLGLEGCDLRVDLADSPFRRESGIVRARSGSVLDQAPILLRPGELAFESSDLHLHANDVWILVAVARAQLQQVLFQLCKLCGRGVGDSDGAGRARLSQLLHQRRALISRTQLVHAAQMELSLESL